MGVVDGCMIFSARGAIRTVSGMQFFWHRRLGRQCADILQ